MAFAYSIDKFTSDIKKITAFPKTENFVEFIEMFEGSHKLYSCGHFVISFL